MDKKANDYQGVVDSAAYFAKGRKVVQLLPKVHYKNELYKELFGELKGTKYERKCPDFKIGDFYYKYESFIGESDKNKVYKMVSRGLKQSSRIVIEETKATNHQIETIMKETFTQ